MGIEVAIRSTEPLKPNIELLMPRLELASRIAFSLEELKPELATFCGIQ